MTMYRAWVCNKCKIISYHHVVYCPSCGNKFDFIKDEGLNLLKLYPTSTPESEYTPYEWSGEKYKHKQPWCYRGYKMPENEYERNKRIKEEGESYEL